MQILVGFIGHEIMESRFTVKSLVRNGRFPWNLSTAKAV